MLWKPIFHEGEIVCFAAGHIHNTDMGGAVPASLSRALTEIHQEGIRFTPMKLYRAGVLNQELLRRHDDQRPQARPEPRRPQGLRRRA